MRAATAKLLRRAARRVVQPYGDAYAARRVYQGLKRRWNRTPWNERAAMRRRLQEIVRGVA